MVAVTGAKGVAPEVPPVKEVAPKCPRHKGRETGRGIDSNWLGMKGEFERYPPVALVMYTFYAKKFLCSYLLTFSLIDFTY